MSAIQNCFAFESIRERAIEGATSGFDRPLSSDSYQLKLASEAGAENASDIWQAEMVREGKMLRTEYERMRKIADEQHDKHMGALLEMRDLQIDKERWEHEAERLKRLVDDSVPRSALVQVGTRCTECDSLECRDFPREPVWIIREDTDA